MMGRDHARLAALPSLSLAAALHARLRKPLLPRLA